MTGLLALFAFVCVTAAAEPRVQVVETHPASTAVLGHWEQFFLRIAYDADRPVRVRAAAYDGEERVSEVTSGSPLYDPGQGEALFWFAWTKPGRVDRIVIRAVDAKTSRPIAEADLAVSLTMTGQKRAAKPSRPQWVTAMLAERNRKQNEAFKRQMERPTPWWELVLFQLVMLSIPTYFILQGVLLWRWRGGWRIAAGVPAAIMALILVHALFALFAGSNIWPILLIFTAPPALIYLVVLLIVRGRLSRRGEAARQ